tara:strand:+ start:610 stop:2625 length:2016 start_codon:yes stop_codon:yes gene_type:complete
MARKSPWQQFSDNFSSVYGSFKELGQGIESARIMAEDPEVITMGGIKQPHQDYQATYGGKTYDKEITPEMLTGLRNQRLADVKRKYGDVQGAMDMELKSAQLIESRNKAKLDEQTFDSNVQIAANQADLGEVQVDQALVNLSQSQVEHQSYIDTLPDREKLIYAQAIGAELDNDGKTIKNYIAEATKEDAIQAVKLGVTALEIQNVNAELAGEGLTLDNEGKLISNEIASATKGLKIGRAALENAKMILENKGLYLTTEGQVLTLERSKAIHEKEKQKDAIRVENELTELQNTQDFNNAYKDFAAKAALGDKEGGFASQEEANNYLLTNLSKISPEYAVLAMELQQKYSKHEIQNINDQGALLKSKAMQAMAKGGPDAVREIVDEMNGINNVKVETKDGIVTMTEVTPDGKFVRTIATGKEGAEFTTNLDMALDPANMMATSKAYHDANKTAAEADYYNEMAKAKGVKTPLTKDQWAIQRITKNPNDTLGYAMLLGEGYDLQSIASLVTDSDVDGASNAANQNGNGDPDPDGNDDGDGSTQGGLKQQKPLKDSLMEEIAKQENIIQNTLPTNPAHKKATERLNYINSKAGSEELIAGIDAKLKELGPMEVLDPDASPRDKGNNQKKTRNKLREKHTADRKALMDKLGTATAPDPSTLVSSSNMNLGLSANR